MAVDILTALLGGISGGLAAGWVLRRPLVRQGSQEHDPWVPADEAVQDIEDTVRRYTDDPVKQRLLGRKLLLGMEVSERRRARGRSPWRG